MYTNGRKHIEKHGVGTEKAGPDAGKDSSRMRKKAQAECNQNSARMLEKTRAGCRAGMLVRLRLECSENSSGTLRELTEEGRKTRVDGARGGAKAAKPRGRQAGKRGYAKAGSDANWRNGLCGIRTRAWRVKYRLMGVGTEGQSRAPIRFKFNAPEV